MASPKTPLFDINDIVQEVQSLYKKDEKSKSMITTGASIRQAYKAEDGVPLKQGHPIQELTGLPCVPFNKIIQFSGEPDVGKSTVLGEIMASAQKAGFLVIILDSEDKFDAKRYDGQFKGDSSKLILIKTNETLQGGEKVRKVIIAAKTKHPDLKILFCWDSVGGSQSRSHAERELDSEKHASPGADAKDNGSVMKMLVGLINKYPDSISVVLANQVYSKIGFMQHGNKESGGKKIEFHSSLIVQLRRVKVLTKVTKGVKMKYGILSRATVSKNHLSQSETSIHQMDFEITAAGIKASDIQDISDGDEE